MQGTLLEQVLHFAPLVTPFIALVATGMAIVSWRTQVSIARKRAAIDVFLKTEMDMGMLKAYTDFDGGILRSKNYSSIEQFEKEDPSSYHAVRVYLDVHELICIGVKKKVFDEDVCYGFWSAILRDAMLRGRGVVEHARKPDDTGHTYDNVIEINKQWLRRAEKSQVGR